MRQTRALCRENRYWAAGPGLHKLMSKGVSKELPRCGQTPRKSIRYVGTVALFACSPASASYRCWDPAMAGIRQGGQAGQGERRAKGGARQEQVSAVRPSSVFALQRPRNPGVGRNQEREVIRRARRAREAARQMRGTILLLKGSTVAVPEMGWSCRGPTCVDAPAYRSKQCSEDCAEK